MMSIYEKQKRCPASRNISIRVYVNLQKRAGLALQREVIKREVIEREVIKREVMKREVIKGK